MTYNLREARYYGIEAKTEKCYLLVSQPRGPKSHPIVVDLNGRFFPVAAEAKNLGMYYSCLV